VLISSRRSLLYRPAVIAAAASPTWVKTDGPAIQNINNVSDTATFTSVAVNSGATDVVVVCVGGTGQMASITVSIGGDAMTKAIQNTGANCASVWYKQGAYVTPNIVVFAGSSVPIDDIGISVGKLSNVTAAPTSTAKLDFNFHSDPITMASSVTVPSGGFAIAMATNASDNDPTWTNITEDYDLSNASLRFTSGYSSSAGALTPALNGWNGNGSQMAVATWGA
jgi:hypothetical protein